MSTWETNEICRQLANSGMYNSNLSADALEEMFYDMIPESLDGTLDTLLRAALKEVDWDEVAESVAEETECEDCTNSFTDESEAEQANWLDDGGLWYCIECREDFENCADCDERMPADELEDGLCSLCWYKEDHSPEPTEEAMPLRIGGIVDKPGDKEVATYDYGQIVGTTEKTADVCWFKWGFVPEEYRDGNNVVYWTEKLSDLKRVSVLPATHNKAVVKTYLYDLFVTVEEGDTVYQTNAHQYGVIKAIYMHLKQKSDYRKFVVEIEDGTTKLWSAKDCIVKSEGN